MSFSKQFATFIFALLCVFAPAFAQIPEVFEVAQGEVDGSSLIFSPEPWVILDGIAYFAAFDPQHGKELWRSDGTEAGTRLVHDLCPGPCSAFPDREILRIFEGQVVLVADDGAFGHELWTTDGTADGTRLLADLCFGTCDGVAWVEPFGDRLLAGGYEEATGFEPWVVDRQGNAKLVADLCPGECSSFPREPAAAGGRFFFIASDGQPSGYAPKLVSTDGTAAGTHVLTAGSTGPPLRFGDQIVFVSQEDATGLELWASDGTPAGTQLLLDLCPGPCFGVSDVFVDAVDHAIYLNAVREIGGTTSLFRSDGTAAGTILVAESIQASAPLLRLGDELLFAAQHGDCSGLWATRDTPDSTRSLTCDGAPNELAALGGRLFAAFDQGLFAGLPDELAEVRSFARRHGRGVSRLTAFGDRILFNGFSEATGFELWSSDGTPGATAQVRNIHRADASGAPRQLAEIGGAVLFQASEGAAGEPRVWRVDGTPDGSFAMPVGPRDVSAFVRHGKVLLYSSRAFLHSEETDGLWRTDGTPEGTTRLVQRFAGLQGNGSAARQQLLQGWQETASGGTGSELWTTDGTPEGTRFVADLYPGGTIFTPPTPFSSSPEGFTRLGGQTLFAATNSRNGRELWTSDGTADGTSILRDICRDCSSEPTELTRLGLRTVFVAKHPRLGRELWRTDGTRDGTRPVLDLRRGPRSSSPHNLVALRGRIVFAVRAGNNDGESLWRTDGLLRGTRRLAALGPGAFVTESLRVGRLAFFAVTNPVGGPELWVSDGTKAGTRHLLDLRTGPGGAPTSFAEVDGRLLFAADDGVHGEELWASDGTPDGTRRLTDLAPGVAPSGPREILAAGERIYFAADDGTRGRELWSIDRASLGGAPGRR